MTPRPWSRAPRASALALVLVSLGGWSCLGAAIPDTNGETMIVPGGTEAIARLLGSVDSAPERFGISLNRALLRTIRQDHDWEKIEERVALSAFLLTVSDLEGRLSFPLVLEGTSSGSAQRLDVLARTLGYALESPGPPFRVEAIDDAFAGNRQRCAQALGWNLAGVAHRLNAGETVVLHLPHDEVPFLIDPDTWGALTAKPVSPSTALVELAGDQRLGLVVEGLRRLTRETREALSKDDLTWLYGNAAIAFYRYSLAIEIRDGRLRLPGGSGTADAWAAWVGADPSDWRPFVRRILAERDAELAHVWAALYPIPEPVARYYAENFVAEPWARTRLDPILDTLTSAYGRRYFTGARGTGPGFQSIYRAVPLDGSDGHPHVPHGPGLWLHSLLGDAVPKDDAALAKSVSKAMRSGSGIDEAECLAQCMKRADLASKEPFPIQRYLRSGHVLDGYPDLLTAENVFLVNRAVAVYPQAIRTLQRLRVSRPETVRAYLMTVSRFERGEMVAGRVGEFQGGIAILVGISEGGKVDDAILESSLMEWLALFHSGVQDDELPMQIAAWLAALLHRLPEPPPTNPGKGPLERAWLDAMAGGRDPQAFEWDGLSYEGRRARDGAASMLAVREREDLPPVDEVLQSVTEIGELRAAVIDLDLDRAHEIASRALERGDVVRPPAFTAERVRLLTGVLAVSHAAELSVFDRSLEDLRHSEAERLDPLLIAPPYLVPMSKLDSALVEGQRLVRRHQVLDERPTTLYPDPWSAAQVVRDAEGRGLSYLVGHLGDVQSALIEIVVQSLNPGPAAVQVAVLPRHARWLEDVTGPSWSRVTPEALQLVAALVDVGDSIVEQAAAEIRTGERGPARDFAAERVPLHRLENGSRGGAAAASVSVTPSERFSLGLAAVAGDLSGGPAPELIDGTHRASVSDALRETPNPWKALEAVGAGTPHVNGRFRPWMGSWLPYEALDRDVSVEALVERELIDVRLAIALFLARHRLPPEVGSDLQRYALARVPAELHPASAEDWESVLVWVDRLDDAYFKDGMRRCLEQGLYRVSDF